LGENIIYIRGSSGFSKNFMFEISDDKDDVECGDQIQDKINGEIL
jgi:hypothetical protein